MPGVVAESQRKVLSDSTKAHSNLNVLPSPNAAKRRKLDLGSSPATGYRNNNRVNGVPGSSQPKSTFEEEVLEKLSQDITDLKHKNSEKGQQWDRPPLRGFDEKKDSLCFQQIEAERGFVQGGQTAVSLFGVTEVR